MLVPALVLGATALGACAPTPPRTDAAPAPGGTASPAGTAPADPCARLDLGALRTATGWDLQAGSRPAGYEQPGQLVCNWESSDLQGAVQLQVHAHGGRGLFDDRRATAEQQHLPSPRDVTVPGAEAAYEIPGHGIVGVLEGDEFVQLKVIGTLPDAASLTRLAEATRTVPVAG